MIRIFLSLVLSFFTLSSVFAGNSENTRHYSFAAGSQQWTGDFTDYPKGQEQFYELAWGWENLPTDQNPQKSATFTKGIYLAGNNHSDDLFMYIKTPIQGLKANTQYAVTLSVNLATNVPEGKFGIGGSPGESVALKVGASTEEPIKIDRNGFYLLNVDKGNQQISGENAVVVGNLANPLVDSRNPQYAAKQVNNFNNPILVKTDSAGKLWIFVGTDSGFEGPSKYYVGEVNVNLRED